MNFSDGNALSVWLQWYNQKTHREDIGSKRLVSGIKETVNSTNPVDCYLRVFGLKKHNRVKQKRRKILVFVCLIKQATERG